MAEENTALEKSGGGLAKTEGKHSLKPGNEMTQMVPGIMGDEFKEYTVGGKKLMAKPVYTYLEPEDYYEITKSIPPATQGGQWIKKSTFILLLDGKKKICQLAGVGMTGHFSERTTDVCEYIAEGIWLAPTGAHVPQQRIRRIDLNAERSRQLINKSKKIFENLAGANEGTAAGQAYAEHKAGLMQMLSEGKSMEEALMATALKVLTIKDMIDVNENVSAIREHFAAVVQSKAESQLGTAYIRLFGGRVTASKKPEGKMLVTLVNTVEIPDRPADAVDLMYEPEGDEQDAVEDVETAKAIQSSSVEEVVQQEDVRDAEYVVSHEGTVIDTSTGEVLGSAPNVETETQDSTDAQTPEPEEAVEQEPVEDAQVVPDNTEEQLPSEPADRQITEDEMRDQIAKNFARLGMSQSQQINFKAKNIKLTDLTKASSEQLHKLLELLDTIEAKPK